MTAPADFEDAVKQFEEFLRKEGETSPIVWVWPEDVLATGKRYLYGRIPVSEGNQARVAVIYDQAVREGLGVRFSTLCQLPDATCCYVWGSREDHRREPQSWPLHGLMMSVKKDTNRIPGKPLGNGLRWAWLSWWHRKKQSAKALMFH